MLLGIFPCWPEKSHIKVGAEHDNNLHVNTIVIINSDHSKCIPSEPLTIVNSILKNHIRDDPRINKIIHSF